MNVEKIKREAGRILQQALLIGDLFCWIWRRALKRDDGVIFYLTSPVHYPMFRDIHRHLPLVRIVAGNRKTAESLRADGVTFTTRRMFPRVVIMADYCKNAFPFPWIRKIQLWHGVGCKKTFFDKAAPKYDLYLTSGEHAAAELQRKGICRVAVVGYPKTDGLHNGSYDRRTILESLGADAQRKTILFAPTWGEISSAPKIPDVICELGSRYNVLVKLHDHSPEEWRATYRHMAEVIYLESPDISPYMVASDLLISDFSTAIFEFAQLLRPVISYDVAPAFLRENSTDPAWWEITEQVSNKRDLRKSVEALLGGWTPGKKHHEILGGIFGARDGGAAVRAAQEIELFIEEGGEKKWKP
jgi:hypothetical protein